MDELRAFPLLLKRAQAGNLYGKQSPAPKAKNGLTVLSRQQERAGSGQRPELTGLSPAPVRPKDRGKRTPS